MPAPAITLLTDFGTADGYVAELKGVLTTRATGVPILDMSHDVPNHDIEFARLTLARYWKRFPVGTVRRPHSTGAMCSRRWLRGLRWVSRSSLSVSLTSIRSVAARRNPYVMPMARWKVKC